MARAFGWHRVSVLPAAAIVTADGPGLINRMEARARNLGSGVAAGFAGNQMIAAVGLAGHVAAQGISVIDRLNGTMTFGIPLSFDHVWTVFAFWATACFPGSGVQVGGGAGRGVEIAVGWHPPYP